MAKLKKKNELIIVRHAKSSWKHPELSDFERPLNKRGKRDAPFMGEKLSDKNVSPDLILASPAKRAFITAKIISEKVKYPADKIAFNKNIYEASVNDLLKIINDIDEHRKSVMLVGHNPGLTSLNNFLTNRFIDNIPTCGIVSIIFNCKWQEVDEASGEVDYFIYPKLFLNE